MTFIQGTEWAPGARMKLNKKHVAGQSKLFDQHDRLVPRGAHGSLTLSD